MSLFKCTNLFFGQVFKEDFMTENQKKLLKTVQYHAPFDSIRNENPDWQSYILEWNDITEGKSHDFLGPDRVRTQVVSLPIHWSLFFSPPLNKVVFVIKFYETTFINIGLLETWEREYNHYYVNLICSLSQIRDNLWHKKCVPPGQGVERTDTTTWRPPRLRGHQSWVSCRLLEELVVVLKGGVSGKENHNPPLAKEIPPKLTDL